MISILGTFWGYRFKTEMSPGIISRGSSARQDARRTPQARQADLAW
jgi:hypothetical protein